MIFLPPFLLLIFCSWIILLCVLLLHISLYCVFCLIFQPQILCYVYFPPIIWGIRKENGSLYSLLLLWNLNKSSTISSVTPWFGFVGDSCLSVFLVFWIVVIFILVQLLLHYIEIACHNLLELFQIFVQQWIGIWLNHFFTSASPFHIPIFSFCCNNTDSIVILEKPVSRKTLNSI